jgi:peptidoglycan/LPS O-acetylase OafA/YrhL
VITLLAVGGAFLTTLPSSQYFSLATLKYYLTNLAFMNFLAPDLPGVFEGNRLTAVNGALWTLKVEVMFYLSVPLIAWGLRRFGKPAVLGFLYLASVGYYLTFEHLFATTGRMLYFTLAQQFPGALAYFVSGAALYYYGDRLGRVLPWAAAGSAIFLQFNLGWASTALQPAALGLLVIWLAVSFPYLGNFGKYGDLSYGLYIVHFPILQTLVSLGVFARDPYLGLGLALLFGTVAAFASWHLVEKPFLRRSSHYVMANTAG